MRPKHSLLPVLLACAAFFLSGCSIRILITEEQAVDVSSVAPPSGLSYALPRVHLLNHVYTAILPTVSGTVDSYSVSPALPTGLSLDTTTGAISGTPTLVAAPATYRVTATNTAGSTDVDLALRVANGYLVTSNGDASDADAGADGVCDTGAGACTLRAAMAEINATPAGRTVIYIPAMEITLGASLPLVLQNLEVIGEDQDIAVIDGDGQRRLFACDSDTITMTFSHLTMRDGYTGSIWGAAIQTGFNDCSIAASHVSFLNNTSAGGAGAIHAWGTGTLSLSDSVFIGNTGSDGGAVRAGGSTVIDRCLFSGNSTSTSGGAIQFSSGGTVRNSTFYNNSATNNAGAISVNAGTLTLTNSTLANNSSPGAFGAGALQGGGAVTATNVILYQNTGPRTHCSTTVTSNGGNLVFPPDGDCGMSTASDIAPADPLLGALQDNDGPNHTMALSGGSPAIDSGTNAGCPGVDQRGLPRPVSVTCDSGAFEAQ